MSSDFMLKRIRKRDGSFQKFDKEKIISALNKAFLTTGEGEYDDAKRIGNNVTQQLERLDHAPTVEEIQDRVETSLMRVGSYRTAKKYIIYREQHSKARNISKLVHDTEIVQDYINKEDWRVKENSNMTYSLQGLNNYLSSRVVSNYWLEEIYPEDIKKSNHDGNIHIHDLGTLGAYCVGWDMRDLLDHGFNGVSGKVNCKPPKHLKVAMGQIVNFLYTLQGESAGAQAFSDVDAYLAPFISYDNISYDELKQAMQEFIFNLNVPTRTGFQSPFENFTLSLKTPSYMENEPVIIGGEYMEDTYGDFADEANMFNRAFGEVMNEGDGRGNPFSFPIPTLNITKDFDWDNENYYPLWEMTSKYGIPYFSNFVNSDMNPDDVRSMCPLKEDEKILVKTKNGLHFSEIRHIYYDFDNPIEVYSNGKWVKGLFNKYDNQEMIKVTLENGHNISMSKTHLNIIKTNINTPITEIVGSDLKEGQYLPYGLNVYEGIGGTYETGYIVGAFAGNGSFDGNSTTVFSLNTNEKDTVVNKLINIAVSIFGATHTIKTHDDTKLLTLSIHSEAINGLCRDFVSNIKTDKHYSANLFGMSKEFRLGVFDGHYDTDGGNRNRIYTSSEKMVESLNMLASTLGTTTSIQIDNREGRYSDNPNYSVLFYKLNRKNYGDMWFKEDGYLWMKIKSITPEYGNVGYCLEVLNDEPLFTVGTTGIITHNCRLRLNKKELIKRGGGLFGANPLTGSIGVVTINMPKLGYVSKDDSDFYERLDSLMDLAKNALIIKRNIIENYTENGLYPYSSIFLRDVKARHGKYWANHFSTIGLVGMNECLENFMDSNMFMEDGIGFTLNVLDHMNERMIDYQEETGHLFNLEATPAEGCSYRLARIDKHKYPDIITAGTDEVPYYTNSTQLPVNYTNNLFKAMTLQDNIQSKYTGGTVFHIFLQDEHPNVDSLKNMVGKITNSFKMPYFTITPTFSTCPNHGYFSGQFSKCPMCGERCEVYSRVVGYLRPVSQWNEGKTKEFEERKTFNFN
jgi:ribonucleoside-triphosphate reductase